MFLYYLLLVLAVAVFCIGMMGRRSGYVIGYESLAFAAFLVFWLAGMSLLPERSAVGVAVAVLLAIGCALVVVVLELGASPKSREIEPMTPAAEREEAHVEDSARLTIAGFFWAALFGIAAVAFAPYLLS